MIDKETREYIRAHKWMQIVGGLLLMLRHPIATALLLADLATDDDLNEYMEAKR